MVKSILNANLGLLLNLPIVFIGLPLQYKTSKFGGKSGNSVNLLFTQDKFPKFGGKSGNLVNLLFTQDNSSKVLGKSGN